MTKKNRLNLFQATFLPLGIAAILGMALFLSPRTNWAAQQQQPPFSKESDTRADSGGNIRVLLSAFQETTLSSRTSGLLTGLEVSHGESFTKGKKLAQLECGEQTARLAMARAELSSARELYEAKLRMQALKQASDMDVAVTAAEVAKYQAQVRLHMAQVAQCTVEAPFTGKVVKVVAKPYQSVSQGQPLLEIVADGPLKLRLNVPAAWTLWLRHNHAFEVTIDETGKRYPARVTALNGRVDPVSQTMELEGMLTQTDEDLLPGMSGTASFSRPAKDPAKRRNIRP